MCAKHNIAKVKFEKTHFKGAQQPMKFILMDLIGEFHPPSQQGHRYALTVICMHTSYVFCIPLKTMTAQEVIQAFMRHVYSRFVGSEKILITVLSSKPNCLRKYPNNWACNARFTHLPTGPSATVK